MFGGAKRGKGIGMSTQLEMGIDTFGDVTFGANGQLLPHDQVLRNVVAEGVLADQAGIGFFGVGEHHRSDFAVSAPEIVLAALAAKTSRIRLGTAVTVLSSDDPVRLFQRFSTLNALSDGRAEVILGRGSFTESFPLFGFDLQDYAVLFEEKLELFHKLLTQEKVSWSGTTRGPLKSQQVFPLLGPKGLTTWIGVGGSPESVVRAVHYDMPMMLAIIGGNPARFRAFIKLYKDAYAQTGGTPRPLGVHSPGLIADSDAEAREQLWPHYQTMINKIGRERGWPPTSRAQFNAEVDHGSLYVGTPETVAAKIVKTVQALGIQRFEMKYSAGALPHEVLMRSIELYGTKVIPLVRDMLS